MLNRVQMPDVVVFITVAVLMLATGSDVYKNKLHKNDEMRWGAAVASQYHESTRADKLDVLAETRNAMEELSTKWGDGLSINMPGMKETLSVKQTYILTFAYFTAKKDRARPEILQGILWQESKAGEYKGYKVAGQEYGLGPMQRYYGVAQIKLGAARDVLKKYPNEFQKFETDEELIANLILNDEFNVKIASKYLQIIAKSGVTVSRNQQIASYNRGVTGATKVNVDSFHYTVGVNTHIRRIMDTVNREIYAFTRANNKPYST